ncbi:hypothetical protein [Pseudomonas fluorescens]|uniref:Uncharacterized protein n=1 Tax=Pseudomonas fluorescens TaxID=294 RepID=A0A5E7ANY0_PSEFL|nr:hypothetical protein [Pseudomonas fluorescens]VVN41895.1 hypothetical protein PS676_05425 [Pseudomonas fluorescens]VVN79610.1 hypothetical protein PS704_00996 [Pseudomonas fluorescens]
MRLLTLLSAFLFAGLSPIALAAGPAYPKESMIFGQVVIDEISNALSGKTRTDFDKLALRTLRETASNISLSAPTYRVSYSPVIAVYVSVVTSDAQNVLYRETSITKLSDKETGRKYSVTWAMARCEAQSITPLYTFHVDQSGNIVRTFLLTRFGDLAATDDALVADSLNVVCGKNDEAAVVSEPLVDAGGLFGE